MKTEENGQWPQDGAGAAASASRPIFQDVIFPDVTRDDVFRLETKRLWLRWPRLADLAAFEGFVGRAEVAEMTGSFPHPLPRGEAERRIFEARKRNATGTGLVLAVTPLGRPNVQIGSIGLTPARVPGTAGEVELGYMLDPGHWGQGLATEAVQALLDAAFRYAAIQAVSAWTRVNNPGSRRVLEKSHFRHVGTALRDMPARGGMLPCEEFSLGRKAWDGRWEADPAARWGKGQNMGAMRTPAHGFERGDESKLDAGLPQGADGAIRGGPDGV